MLFCFSLILVVVLVYFALVFRFTFWSRRGVKQYTFWEIWVKNIIEVIRQPSLTEAITKLYHDFSDERYVGTYQLFIPRLCIKDPELIKQIFVKDFDHFVDHTMFIPTDGDPIWEKSLFSLTGNKWRKMRAIASPSLTSRKIKIMFELMTECANNFLVFLEEQNTEIITLEMKEIFGRVTNDMFASTHFGVTCDSLRNPQNEFYLMGKRGADFGGFWIKFRFVLIQMIPRITTILGIKVFSQKVSTFFKTLVRDNIHIREKDGIVRPDLLHLLMETRKDILKNGTQKDLDSEYTNGLDISSKKNECPQLTDEDITAIAMAFFGGGFDSTSTLLCFIAYELALQPDIQQKLQIEVDSAIARCKKGITYDSLQNMKYLEMVVYEALRKWPGGFFLDRRCVKPYTISPVKDGEQPIHFKTGDSVWLPLFALQRDPQFYPEPDRFDPERFSGENKFNVLNSYMYMPFGIGPRHCIGNRFALLEAKVVTFFVLSKFSFVVTEKTSVPLRLARRNFQLASRDGFWLGLKRRNQVL